MSLIIVLTTFISAFYPIGYVYGQSSITVNLEGLPEGYVGDKRIISGVSAVAFDHVEVYWDLMDPGKKLNETYANSDGIYECEIDIPEDVAGTHYIIVKSTVSSFSNHTDFQLFPKIILSSDSGLPGDEIIVNGTGFAALSNITIIFENSTYSNDVTSAEFRSSEMGSFSSSFTLPNVCYGVYAVRVKDDEDNQATHAFVVEAVIGLIPKEGAAGTIVTISGRGFTESADVAIAIKIDNTTVQQVSPIETRNDGTFEGKFIVPTLDEREYNVTAIDENGISSYTSFAVNRKTRIILDPKAGPPGTEDAIRGDGFTAITATKVTVNFGSLIVKSFYTNSTGGFEGTFTVPWLPIGTYGVTATDVNELNATAIFRIAVTVISLEPSEGPAGTKVKVTGYGFTSGKNASIAIDTMPILSVEVDSELVVGKTFVIPTLPTGVHTITVTDEDGLKASALFRVTETTELILTPYTTTCNKSVTVEAKHFTSQAGILISFIMKNSTWKTSLTVTPTPLTNEAGGFKGSFVVPTKVGAKTIAEGSYVVRAEDALGLAAEASLYVTYPIVQVRTRSLEYFPGETVSFYVNSTFAYTFTISVEDPVGIEIQIFVPEPDWQTVGNWNLVPYEKASFTLPNDAEPGAWRWSATLGLVKESGSFEVVGEISARKLSEDIDLLREKIANIEESLSSVSQKMDEMSSELSEGLSETLSSLKYDITALQKELNATKNDLLEIKSAVRTTQEESSYLTTITYIVIVSSIISATAAVLALIAIIELGRMVVR